MKNAYWWDGRLLVFHPKTQINLFKVVLKRKSEEMNIQGKDKHYNVLYRVFPGTQHKSSVHTGPAGLLYKRYRWCDRISRLPCIVTFHSRSDKETQWTWLVLQELKVSQGATTRIWVLCSLFRGARYQKSALLTGFQLSYEMLATSEEQNSAPEEAVKSLKPDKSPEIVVESDTEESTSEVATSTVQSSQPDDSEPTTVTDQDYLGDESSSYLNTNAECSELSSSLNVDENFSDRTSPSKSIPEIPGSLISETDSELRDKLSTPGLDNYEEFSNSEISEAKIAEPPEPHTGSPIRDVLLALQNEAIKYRNIQETCNDALEELASNQKEVLTVRSYCFLPLKLAYDTRLPRFCILAVTGFRHLVSDPLLKATSVNPNKASVANIECVRQSKLINLAALVMLCCPWRIWAGYKFRYYYYYYYHYWDCFPLNWPGQFGPQFPLIPLLFPLLCSVNYPGISPIRLLKQRYVLSRAVDDTIFGHRVVNSTIYGHHVVNSTIYGHHVVNSTIYGHHVVNKIDELLAMEGTQILTYEMLATSEEQNSAPEEAVKSLKPEKSPEIVVESDTEESTSEVATSTVQSSSQPDDSEPTTVTDQDYLGDESSSYLNTNAECSELSSSLNVNDNFSDRTSPSKSIPEIPGSLISETDSELRDKLSTPGLDNYEEFSNSEISEAKIAEPPEPHTGSPIRDVLLALQNEAIKYRNIQVYKLCLAVVCTDKRTVHHEHIIKMLELCLEQAVKHKETSHKALAHSTFLQMLSQLPRNITDTAPQTESTYLTLSHPVWRPRFDSQMGSAMLIDGVTQSSLCGDSTMLGMSASVMVALLESIQQLSNSTGVTSEHRERISGALEDMDAKMQAMQREEQEESETEDLFTPATAGVVQTFFTGTEGDPPQPELVRTERADESETEDEGEKEQLRSRGTPATPDNTSTRDNTSSTTTGGRETPRSDQEEVDVTDTVFSSNANAVGPPYPGCVYPAMPVTSALKLGKKLHRSTHPTTLPVSEAQFTEWVQGSGGLIMASSVWLQEVYRTVLEVDMLTMSEFDLEKPSTLLSLLEKFSQSDPDLPGCSGERVLPERADESETEDEGEKEQLRSRGTTATPDNASTRDNTSPTTTGGRDTPRSDQEEVDVTDTVFSSNTNAVVNQEGDGGLPEFQFKTKQSVRKELIQHTPVVCFHTTITVFAERRFAGLRGGVPMAYFGILWYIPQLFQRFSIYQSIPKYTKVYQNIPKLNIFTTTQPKKLRVRWPSFLPEF
eukprot:sb/3461177/